MNINTKESKEICPTYVIAADVARSLTEDLAFSPDWSASLIQPDSIARAKIRTRDDMLMCGSAWLEHAFYLCDNDVEIKWFVQDGDRVSAGSVLCEIHGVVRGLLSAERTALNFLQTLSGTATQVMQYVKQIFPFPVKIMDTRKTVPGLRLAQKYAVAIGGGYNQRYGLYDGVLIKENHIFAYGGIKEVLEHAFATLPQNIPIQIEVENFSQLVEALNAGARLILLDNMSVKDVSKCVKYANGNAELEVSGNITLNNVLDYAKTGVERISIGALTKHVYAVDLSMRIE